MVVALVVSLTLFCIWVIVIITTILSSLHRMLTTTTALETFLQDFHSEFLENFEEAIICIMIYVNRFFYLHYTMLPVT